MTTIGSIESYDPAKEDWSSYSKRFEQYVIVNELKDEKKDCNSFLEERREQRLQPIEGLKGPSQAFRIQACRTVGSVEQPFPTETNHYCGASSLSQAWSRRRGRNGGLRRSTKTVFGTLRVRRIPWASIKGQICLWIAKQANPKEAANWNRTNLEKGPWYGHSHGISRNHFRPVAPPSNINVLPARTQNKQGRKPREQKSCFRCGGSHAPQTCRFKDQTCHFCQCKGHIQKVCRKKGASKPERGNVSKNSNPVRYLEDEQGVAGNFSIFKVEDETAEPEILSPSLFGRNWLSKIRLN